VKRIVKKAEERRQEIVSAARELFLEKSYDRTTMQDVMKKVEIAKGTIYHYFQSKEDLLEAVVQDTVDDYLTDVQDALDGVEGNALERMRVLVSAGRVADEQEETMEKLHRSGNIGMHTRQLAVTITKLAPLYANVIEQGCQEGIFQVEHPLESAEFLLAGIQFLTDIGCYSWSQEELARRSLAIPTFLESLLHAKKGSFSFLLES
jgi:AcrR family transcriptional regulator